MSLKKKSVLQEVGDIVYTKDHNLYLDCFYKQIDTKDEDYFPDLFSVESSMDWENLSPLRRRGANEGTRTNDESRQIVDERPVIVSETATVIVIDGHDLIRDLFRGRIFEKNIEHDKYTPSSFCVCEDPAVNGFTHNTCEDIIGGITSFVLETILVKRPNAKHVALCFSKDSSVPLFRRYNDAKRYRSHPKYEDGMFSNEPGCAWVPSGDVEMPIGKTSICTHSYEDVAASNDSLDAIVSFIFYPLAQSIATALSGYKGAHQEKGGVAVYLDGDTRRSIIGTAEQPLHVLPSQELLDILADSVLGAPDDTIRTTLNVSNTRQRDRNTFDRVQGLATKYGVYAPDATSTDSSVSLSCGDVSDSICSVVSRFMNPDTSKAGNPHIIEVHSSDESVLRKLAHLLVSTIADDGSVRTCDLYLNMQETDECKRSMVNVREYLKIPQALDVDPLSLEVMCLLRGSAYVSSYPGLTMRKMLKSYTKNRSTWDRDVSSNASENNANPVPTLERTSLCTYDPVCGIVSPNYARITRLVYDATLTEGESSPNTRVDSGLLSAFETRHRTFASDIFREAEILIRDEVPFWIVTSDMQAYVADGLTETMLLRSLSRKTLVSLVGISDLTRVTTKIAKSFVHGEVGSDSQWTPSNAPEHIEKCVRFLRDNKKQAVMEALFCAKIRNTSGEEIDADSIRLVKEKALKGLRRAATLSPSHNIKQSMIDTTCAPFRSHEGGEGSAERAVRERLKFLWKGCKWFCSKRNPDDTDIRLGDFRNPSHSSPTRTTLTQGQSPEASAIRWSGIPSIDAMISSVHWEMLYNRLGSTPFFHYRDCLMSYQTIRTDSRLPIDSSSWGWKLNGWKKDMSSRAQKTGTLLRPSDPRERCLLSLESAKSSSTSPSDYDALRLESHHAALHDTWSYGSELNAQQTLFIRRVREEIASPAYPCVQETYDWFVRVFHHHCPAENIYDRLFSLKMLAYTGIDITEEDTTRRNAEWIMFSTFFCSATDYMKRSNLVDEILAHAPEWFWVRLCDIWRCCFLLMNPTGHANTNDGTSFIAYWRERVESYFYFSFPYNQTRRDLCGFITTLECSLSFLTCASDESQRLMNGFLFRDFGAILSNTNQRVVLFSFDPTSPLCLLGADDGEIVPPEWRIAFLRLSKSVSGQKPWDRLDPTRLRHPWTDKTLIVSDGSDGLVDEILHLPDFVSEFPCYIELDREVFSQVQSPDTLAPLCIAHILDRFDGFYYRTLVWRASARDGFDTEDRDEFQHRFTEMRRKAGLWWDSHSGLPLVYKTWNREAWTTIWLNGIVRDMARNKRDPGHGAISSRFTESKEWIAHAESLVRWKHALFHVAPFTEANTSIIRSVSDPQSTPTQSMHIFSFFPPFDFLRRHMIQTGLYTAWITSTGNDYIQEECERLKDERKERVNTRNRLGLVTFVWILLVQIPESFHIRDLMDTKEITSIMEDRFLFDHEWESTSRKIGAARLHNSDTVRRIHSTSHPSLVMRYDMGRTTHGIVLQTKTYPDPCGTLICMPGVSYETSHSLRDSEETFVYRVLFDTRPGGWTEDNALRLLRVNSLPVNLLENTMNECMRNTDANDQSLYYHGISRVIQRYNEVHKDNPFDDRRNAEDTLVVGSRSWVIETTMQRNRNMTQDQ